MTCYRYFFALALMALGTSEALADTVTEEEAQSLASKFIHSSSGLMKAKAASSALKLVERSRGHYAYNVGEGGGYVVVASDDNVPNCILGYAEDGSFPVEGMPANMRAWLDGMDCQVMAAAKGGSVRASVDRTGWASVAPLLSSKWNQESPYNGQCPSIGSTQCPTGCVATAGAQVMRYHQWPEKGTGSHSYTWKYEQDGRTQRKTLTADFASSTYDWASMTDTYGSSSTTASKDAVAQLMKDVGYSIDMEYAIEGSGAWEYKLAEALNENFGYADGIHMAYRTYFSSQDWERMVHGELTSARPVIYSGANYTIGHCFVCDGYSSDGYFHINWGWGGMSDGYFLLSVLDPDVQGVGGSSSGYPANQSVIMGVAKADAGLAPLVCADSLYVGGQSVTHGGDITIGLGGAGSYTVGTANFTFGARVVSDADGSSTHIQSSKGGALSYLRGWNDISYTVSTSQFPTTAGSYKVYPALMDKATGKWADIRVDMTAPAQYVTATVSGSRIALATAKGRTLQATSVKLPATVYANRPFTVEATIQSLSGSYDGLMMAYLYDEEGDYVEESVLYLNCAVDEGESTQLTFNMDGPSTAGTYHLALFTYAGDLVDAGRTVSVASEPTGTLTATTAPSDMTVEASSAFTISLKAKASGGDFYGYVMPYAFGPDNNNVSFGSLGNTLVSVKNGTTQTVLLSCQAPAEPGRYLVGFYDEAASGWISSRTNGSASFYLTVTEATNGIASVDAGPVASETAEVYTSGGTLVRKASGASSCLEGLPDGLYVVKQGGKAHKVYKKK